MYRRLGLQRHIPLLKRLAELLAKESEAYIKPARKSTPSFSFLAVDMCKLQMTFCVQTRTAASNVKLKLGQIRYSNEVFRHLPVVISGSQSLAIGLQEKISIKIIIM